MLNAKNYLVAFYSLFRSNGMLTIIISCLALLKIWRFLYWIVANSTINKEALLELDKDCYFLIFEVEKSITIFKMTINLNWFKK